MVEPAMSESVPRLIQQELGRLRLLRTRLWLDAHARLIRRVDEAIASALCPTCAEAQADGVPCEAATGACDHCARALVRIRLLRCELERAVELEEGALVEPLDL